uniref:Uncharacterized protein n=1 Tax=Prasinoderma singulare TaxID=676789 RepID=A0A7S3BA71_9VIRI|mmetsp:Transcript_13533/g.42507  ORF Transcript_13533/g.42507 Transcript_13533/m.42507 type:complete len:438 (+) Transcript_13533:121-1434(+)
MGSNFDVFFSVNGLSVRCCSSPWNYATRVVVQTSVQPLVKAARRKFRDFPSKADMTEAQKRQIKAHMKAHVKTACDAKMREIEEDYDEAKFGPRPAKGGKMRMMQGGEKYEAYLEAQRARQQVGNMSATAVEARRGSQQVANMRAWVVEAKRARQRARRCVGNMSAEKVEAKRARDNRRNRELILLKLEKTTAAMEAAAAVLKAGNRVGAAAWVDAHRHEVTSKFQAAKEELETGIATPQIEEAVCRAMAAWTAHKEVWGVEEQGRQLGIRVNACYSGKANDPKALDTETYRPFKELHEKVDLVVFKAIVTWNGFIANAVEEELQRRLMADERADRTFQLTERGYRPGAGAGRVRKSHLETDFLIPYMKAGLTEEKALLMIKMIRYTLPGQGVALGMAGPELSGAGGSGGASADSPRPSKRLKRTTALDELAAELNE